MSWFLGCTIGSGVIGLLFFLYHLKKGQFDETEETKYQLFRPQVGSKTQTQGDLEGADSRMSSAAKPSMASQRVKHRRCAREVAPGEEFLTQSGSRKD